MLVLCPREFMYVALTHSNSDPKIPDVANLQMHTLTNSATYIHTYIHAYMMMMACLLITVMTLFSVLCVSGGI